MFIIVYSITLYIAIAVFLLRTGYSILESVFPFYNIYLFFKTLKISPLLLMLFGLGLIFLEDRMLLATMFFVFLPFICAYTWGIKKIWAILALLFPFPGYLLLAFRGGSYIYEDRRVF